MSDLRLVGAFLSHQPGDICDRFEPHIHNADGSMTLPPLPPEPREEGADIRLILCTVTFVAGVVIGVWLALNR